MSQHDVVTIRCWQLTGETALEDMVLGVDERAVRDGVNVLSSDDFDACLAIVVCRIGPISMRTSRRWRGITRVTPVASGTAVAVPVLPKGRPMRSNLSRAFIVFPRR